ncbi:hypothetical protein WJX79_007421 [Trebouxia sp. C0005]
MEEARSDAAVRSHWIQDAEPDMIRGHKGRIFDLAFNPVYGGLLASASDESCTGRACTASKREQQLFKSHSSLLNVFQPAVLHRRVLFL